MTNRRIGVIVVTVRKRSGPDESKKEKIMATVNFARIASHIICIANTMRHCSVKKKNRVWLRCAHAR